MKFITIGILFYCSFNVLVAQDISGALLLEKAIQYHDPNHQWYTFDAEFDIVMDMPEKSKRVSHIHINLPEEYFKVTATRDTIITEYIIDKGNCSISLNGKTELSKAELF